MEFFEIPHRGHLRRSGAMSSCFFWYLDVSSKIRTKKSDTLPETNVAPEKPLKIGFPNRKVVFQPSICRGYVSFRECTAKRATRRKLFKQVRWVGLTQPRVKWWFGIRIGVTLSNNPFHKGIPGIQTTGPQTTNAPLAD